MPWSALVTLFHCEDFDLSPRPALYFWTGGVEGKLLKTPSLALFLHAVPMPPQAVDSLFFPGRRGLWFSLYFDSPHLKVLLSVVKKEFYTQIK